MVRNKNPQDDAKTVGEAYVCIVFYFGLTQLEYKWGVEKQYFI